MVSIAKRLLIALNYGFYVKLKIECLQEYDLGHV